MQVRDDVTGTADEPKVCLDTRSDCHATIQRIGHQNDAVAGTDRSKLVVVTVFLAVTRRSYMQSKQ